jgi:hypothetical protein
MPLRLVLRSDGTLSHEGGHQMAHGVYVKDSFSYHETAI